MGPGGACDLDELQVGPHGIPDEAGSIREVRVNCQGCERGLKDHMLQRTRRFYREAFELMQKGQFPFQPSC